MARTKTSVRFIQRRRCRHLAAGGWSRQGQTEFVSTGHSSLARPSCPWTAMCESMDFDDHCGPAGCCGNWNILPRIIPTFPPTLSVSVSVSLFLCPSLSVCLSVCFSFSVSLFLCPSLSVCLSVSFFCLSLSVSVSLCLCLSVCLSLSSVCLFVYVTLSNPPPFSISLCQAVRPPLSFSAFLSGYLFLRSPISLSLSLSSYMNDQ